MTVLSIISAPPLFCAGYMLLSLGCPPSLPTLYHHPNLIHSPPSLLIPVYYSNSLIVWPNIGFGQSHHQENREQKAREIEIFCSISLLWAMFLSVAFYSHPFYPSTIYNCYCLSRLPWFHLSLGFNTGKSFLGPFKSKKGNDQALSISIYHVCFPNLVQTSLNSSFIEEPSFETSEVNYFQNVTIFGKGL